MITYIYDILDISVNRLSSERQIRVNLKYASHTDCEKCMSIKEDS